MTSPAVSTPDVNTSKKLRHDALCPIMRAHKFRRPDNLRISHSELLRRFAYVDGVIVRANIGNGTAKSKVGRIKSTGYHSISIDGVGYLTHHIVWCYHHGYWPIEIDHIDRNKLNNRIENLRECSRSANQQNRKEQIYKRGIRARSYYWEISKGRISASLRVNGINIPVGTYESREDARRAVIIKATELHILSAHFGQ